MRLGVSPAAAPTPTGVFNQRFEALFPGARALGCVVCFAPPQVLPVYLCANVGPPGLLAVNACPVRPTLLQSESRHATRVLSARLPFSTPPTGLDECFFFISLVVGLPFHSIFCQFWLCEEAQCVYLCLHLGSMYHSFLIHSFAEAT